MAPIASTGRPAVIAERFATLAAEWKSATEFLSSSTAIAAHPSYQAIVDLGPPVVPLLLHELEREPAHWFEALQAITGEDPVPTESWGRIPAMAAAWLTWGRQRGLIWHHEAFAACGVSA